MRHLFYMIAKNNKKSMKLFLESNKLYKHFVTADELEDILSSAPLASSGLFQPYDKKCEKKPDGLIEEILRYKMGRGELIFVDANCSANYIAMSVEYGYKVHSLNFDRGVACDRPQNFEMAKLGNAMEALLGRRIVHNISANSERDRYWDKFNNISDRINTPIDLSKYDAVHHIGDIHGCYTVMMNYLKEHSATRLKANEAYIFTGDYFDRGIENDKVFRFLQKISMKPNVFLIVGNHEKLLMDSVWKRSSDPLDDHTQKDFTKAMVTKDEIQGLYLRMVDCVYYQFHDRRVLVTHAGIDKFPKHGLLAMPSYDMIKGIGKSKKCMKTNAKFIRKTKGRLYQIHGHRNPDNAVPIEMNAVCFNVCGFPEQGGVLRSLIFSKNNIDKIETKNNIYNAAK